MCKETIRSDKAPKAAGPYSPAVKVGDFMLLSGQIPIDPATGEIAGEDIAAQTRQCLTNLKNLLAEAGLDMSHILKCNVYLSDINDFAGMNEVYKEFFEEPYPARSCVAVAGIVKNCKVEIDAYAIDTRALSVICSGEECSCCSETECTMGNE